MLVCDINVKYTDPSIGLSLLLFRDEMQGEAARDNSKLVGGFDSLEKER